MTDKPSTEHTEKEEKKPICTLMIDNVLTEIYRENIRKMGSKKKPRYYGKNKYGLIRWDTLEGQAMITHRIDEKLNQKEGQKKDDEGWL